MPASRITVEDAVFVGILQCARNPHSDFDDFLLTDWLAMNTGVRALRTTGRCARGFSSQRRSPTTLQQSAVSHAMLVRLVASRCWHDDDAFPPFHFQGHFGSAVGTQPEVLVFAVINFDRSRAGVLRCEAGAAWGREVRRFGSAVLCGGMCGCADRDSAAQSGGFQLVYSGQCNAIGVDRGDDSGESASAGQDE